MEDLVALRRYLHQHPELSQHEHETQKYLLQLLNALNPDIVTKVANTGILVGFYGLLKGKNILLRADIDALPIQEPINIPHRSVRQGISHKCGHDGHTTILYGLALRYAAERPARGNVFLLFQPAEENGWGARNVIADGVLDNLDIDMVFALHNLPGYKLNNIIYKTGSFTSSVVSLAANFKGYTAHAAEPWNGRNPASAISRYLLAAQQLNEENKPAYVTVTPVYMRLGEKAYGVSAGEGTVHLTIRADTNERMDNALAQSIALATDAATAEGLEVTFDLIEPFESNQNHPDAVDVVVKAAHTSGFEMEKINEGFRFGEDFGVFTNLYRGAMFGIGAGENCKPLHHPDYDYPDELTTTGIEMFINIQQKAQEE